MARFLSSRSLILSPRTASSPGVAAFLPAAHRLLGARHRSDSTAEVHVVEIELDAEGSSSSGPGSGEIEALRRRRVVDDAIHSIVVQRFAPDWIPFVPGASYWVPRQRRPYRVSQLIADLSDSRSADPLLNGSLSAEEKMSFTSERGWPSSAFFVEGLPQRQAKTWREVPKAKSDDEDS